MTESVLLSTKGRTLQALKGRLERFRIPEAIVLQASTWRDQGELVGDRIAKELAGRLVIVRSSAADEDGLQTARAGEYVSVPNLPANDWVAIAGAINQVIASYHRNDTRAGLDEVIIQEMVRDPAMSGVVFTHDLDTGAPYYVINYDDVSGLTHTVTAGDGEYANRTIYVHRSATAALRSKRFQRLMHAIQELEETMGSPFLDVEFALDRDLTPFLLQVRAITTQPNWNRAVAKRIDGVLRGIQQLVKRRLGRMRGVFGETTVLGQMPDWNPAEMIGRAPRALAFSLYKMLITDQAWRLARKTMGYAVPEGRSLMVSLGGQPFIDTRLSFHSYLPARLDPAIGEKLVDVWVRRLRECPELHDKVEFDVAITAYSFDIDERITTLTGGVLSSTESAALKKSLRDLTLSVVSDTIPGGITDALNRIEALRHKQRTGVAPSGDCDLGELFAMMEDCIHLGTIPFAILARHGFIARTLLLSLVRRGVLTNEEVQRMQAGIRTVAANLVEDMPRLRRGELDRATFMDRYGHLRPGTYDLLSLRYDQMPDLGGAEPPARAPVQAPSFVLTPERRKAIDQVLSEDSFPIGAKRLIDYIERATAGREYGKFVFTRSVSNMLELIAAFGERQGLSRDEMSHIPLDELRKVTTTSGGASVEDRLRRVAEVEAERHVVSAAIRLPQVLFDEAGVHIVPFQVSHPNFITTKKVTAACVHLNTSHVHLQLAGKIVLIENADPGFDWIFGCLIAGLVTKYGGANSHMAIRCAEFGIPAAIGCGEQRFEVLLKARQIMLDCSASLIQPLH